MTTTSNFLPKVKRKLHVMRFLYDLFYIYGESVSVSYHSEALLESCRMPQVAVFHFEIDKWRERAVQISITVYIPRRKYLSAANFHQWRKQLFPLIQFFIFNSVPLWTKLFCMYPRRRWLAVSGTFIRSSHKYEIAARRLPTLLHVDCARSIAHTENEARPQLFLHIYVINMK